jgi:hypothetical protein
MDDRAAAATEHHPPDLLARGPDRLEIFLDHAIERRIIGFFERRVERRVEGRDENIETAKLSNRKIGGRAQVAAQSRALNPYRRILLPGRRHRRSRLSERLVGARIL